jgi:hypothetical protein
MSVEVNTVVVQPAVPKLRSRESSVFQDMLSNDAEAGMRSEGAGAAR